MDLPAVRSRRRRSVFRPWNSYLAKKGLVDAADKAASLDLARRRASTGQDSHFAPLARLTTGLLDTYENINADYYQSRGVAAPGLVSYGNSVPVANNSAPTQTLSALHQQQHQTVSAKLLPLGPSQRHSHHGGPNPTVVATTSGSVSSMGYQSTAPVSAFPGSNNKTGSAVGSSSTKRKKKSKTESSPMSVQYCDEHFDYIVRQGEMFNNRYMLEKVIGRGSFGQVVRAYDTRDNTHVAIKIIKNNSLYVEQALSEVRMTSYLNRIDPEDAHSIMRLRDKFIFRGHQCLVLELLSFSLYDLLRSTEFYGVSLNLVRKFCKQILKCLAFLARSDVNIAHCDLKPENVLLRHPQRSAIKVVDFGASCRISETMFTYVQSRFYRAPEVILGLPYATQVDVWSLGCMLIELHTGYPVFAGKDEMHQMTIIVERLGLPPVSMLEAGKKTALYFEKDRETGEWGMKNTGMGNGERVIPGSKPIDAFVDFHTNAANGRRKRVSGGHSEVDYEIFLSLAHKMLRYRAESRITAEEALRDAFVRGCSSLRSGRDSPPPMPAMGSVVEKVVDADVDDGRKAPVQRMTRAVDFVMAETMDLEGSLGEMGDVAEVAKDVGGKLRLSKSEPAFEAVKKKTFVFRTSDWAEGVGIEPPPWRAGGNGGVGVEEVVMGGGWGRGIGRRRKLPGAGGGIGVVERRKRSGGGRVGRGRGRGIGVGGRVGFNPQLPRGHGNALWLYVDGGED